MGKGAGPGAGAGASVAGSLASSHGSAVNGDGEAGGTHSRAATTASSPSTKVPSLEEWLRGLRLERYLHPLQELGAEVVSDVEHIEYSDLDDVGFKKLEKRRFWKAVQALGQG